jgi:hypothetical protein
MVAPAPDTLDRLLDPIARCLSPEVAGRIARLELDAEIRRRLDSYAERSTRGELTVAEQTAYRELVELIDLIGIVQAKARHVAGGTA